MTKSHTSITTHYDDRGPSGDELRALQAKSSDDFVVTDLTYRGFRDQTHDKSTMESFVGDWALTALQSLAPRSCCCKRAAEGPCSS